MAYPIHHMVSKLQTSNS